MQPRLHRAEWHAELLGDLDQGQSHVVMEDEDCSLLGRQSPEAALELVAIGNRQELVVCRRPVDRQDSDAHRPAAIPARLPITGVDEQAMEPRVEPVSVPQRWQLSPGEYQGLLDGIFGKAAIAKDPIRDREESIPSPRARLANASSFPALASSTRVERTLDSLLRATHVVAYPR